jgi:hypothetical protein
MMRTGRNYPRVIISYDIELAQPLWKSQLVVGNSIPRVVLASDEVKVMWSRMTATEIASRCERATGHGELPIAPDNGVGR